MSSVLTVSQLNKYMSFKIKSDLKLKGIAVKGEISDFGIHYKSGHAYFTVKDDRSSIRAVMFASSASRLKFTPENGMSVLVTGNAEIYERDGSCQIIAAEIMPLGAGLLHTQTELIKEKLKKKGIFDESRKKPIPLVPKKIAVVTSLGGAALQDILNIAKRRYPLCTVEIYPALVQGAAAADSVCRALKSADRSGADTIILARGGGSAEDLMPFNSEKTAVAVAECSTPIISAVGHETDTTLADYAADMRAPTPSAAAELATPDMADMKNALSLMNVRLDKAVKARLERMSDRLDRMAVRVRAYSPQRRLESDEKRLEAADDKLRLVMDSRLKLLSMRLDRYAAQIVMLSPFNVLGRGYSMTHKEGRLISSVSEISKGDKVSVRLSDGEFTASIEDIIKLN